MVLNTIFDKNELQLKVAFAAYVEGKNVTSSATDNTGANSSNPLHLISNIRILLNQTLDAVKEQNYVKALNIATTAYLDNFEYVESPSLKVNKVLKQHTEFMMRGDLRMSLRHHAPLADIQKLVKEIKINPDQADIVIQVLVMTKLDGYILLRNSRMNRCQH